MAIEYADLMKRETGNSSANNLKTASKPKTDNRVIIDECVMNDYSGKEIKSTVVTMYKLGNEYFISLNGEPRYFAKTAAACAAQARKAKLYTAEKCAAVESKAYYMKKSK